MIFYFIIVITTYSLACIGSLIIAGTIILFLNGTHKKLWIWLCFIPIWFSLIIAIFAYQLYNFPIFNRALGLGTGLKRFEIWATCWKLFLEKPLTGYTLPVSQDLLEKAINIASPHNAYLSWLLNFGIFGGVFVLFSFLWIGRKLFLNQKNSHSLTSYCCTGSFGFLIGLLFFGLTHSFSADTSFIIPFWIISCCCLGRSDNLEYTE